MSAVSHTHHRSLPFTLPFIRDVIERFPTPFYCYDEQAIRENAHAYTQPLPGAPRFQEFFAVKATPESAHPADRA